MVQPCLALLLMICSHERLLQKRTPMCVKDKGATGPFTGLDSAEVFPDWLAPHARIAVQDARPAPSRRHPLGDVYLPQ